VFEGTRLPGADYWGMEKDVLYRPWAEAEIFELKNGLILGRPIGEVAAFLDRRKDEIRAKARELNLPIP